MSERRVRAPLIVIVDPVAMNLATFLSSAQASLAFEANLVPRPEKIMPMLPRRRSAPANSSGRAGGWLRVGDLGVDMGEFYEIRSEHFDEFRRGRAKFVGRRPSFDRIERGFNSGRFERRGVIAVKAATLHPPNVRPMLATSEHCLACHAK